MIELHQVSADYGTAPILSDVSLRIAAGEQVALLGPSGAGKTTLLRLIGAALVPTSGTCRIHGNAVPSSESPALRVVRSRIATIHQQHDLIARSSVARNVLAGRLGRWGVWKTLRTWVWPAADDCAAVAAVLTRVGLAEHLWDRCDRLSGGQQQRIAIARAMYQDAELLLADEPVSSLDPAQASAVLELLCRTATEDGRTLIASLHHPELARRWFPRLIGLRGGRIIFDLPREEVDDARLANLFSARP